MDDNGLQVVCKYNLKAISFFILQDHVVNLSKVCIILKSRSYQTQYKQHLFANGRSIHLLVETFVQGSLGKYYLYQQQLIHICTISSKIVEVRFFCSS
jgi:hypothetical protein